MRIDVPTLKCDRCEYTTQDEELMQHFHQIYGDSGNDLCAGCWTDFNCFMANTIPIRPRDRMDV